MKRAWILICLWMLSGLALAQLGDVQPKSLLESEEFGRMKTEYRTCVLNKGKELLRVTRFEVAVEYAPVACRRLLLQIKRFMLGSAFKVEVVDGLLASVAEGVQIDLVNVLIAEMVDERPDERPDEKPGEKLKEHSDKDSREHQ